MNGFLVIGKEQSFDVPLGLFADSDAAAEIADEATEADVEAAVIAVWGMPDWGVLCAKSVGIVEFVNGEPQAFQVIKEFEQAPVEV